MEIFRSVTPVVEPLSLDEAFLDVSGAVRLLGRRRRSASTIRDTVHDEQGITCSVGVAPTKFVAKLASGLAKPDGMVVVPRDEVVPFVQQLPVGALWGVGERTEEALVRLGLRTVADIAHTPLATLVRGLGEATGHHLHELAWGGTPARSSGSSARRASAATRPSSTTSTTRPRSTAACWRSASAPRPGCAPPGSPGRTVTLRVRFSDFTTITRSRTLREPTDSGRAIHEAAVGLFDALGLQRARIRLVGVRVEKLVETSQAPIQGVIGEPEHGWRDADRAVDRARSRFGSGAVRPASLVERDTSASAQRPRDLS